MRATLRLYTLVLLIMGAGIGLILYKHLALGFPLLPDEKKLVWTIEAKIDFVAHGDPVKVSFALPPNNQEMVFLNEEFASPDYGFSELDSKTGRRAEWNKRIADGPQTSFYRLSVYKNDRIAATHSTDAPDQPVKPEFDEVLKTAAMTLLKQAHSKSADTETFTRELIKSLNSESPTQNQSLLINNQTSADEKTKLLVSLLAMEGISARVVRGLYLEGGRRRQSLANFIEVHDGDQWLLFNQDTGNSGLPDNFLIWQRGGQSLIDVIGGTNSRVSFSIIENVRFSRNLVLSNKQNEQAGIIDFSIYSLPIEQQNAFKMILLLPIGALVVVVMRLLVGIRTSGTFMPILISLALIETTLIAGIIMFLIVVSVGLMIRSYLSYLNLLLVARISAVIIVVITIMASLSIISHKLGLSQALTVTFFPLIILAWTIERMSVLWEEDGPKEVFIQGAGSLITAIVAYLFMTNHTVEYLSFNFPELMLVNLAFILILGQYTRLSTNRIIPFQITRKTKCS